MNSPEQGKQKLEENVSFGLGDLIKYLRGYILDIIDLKKGVDANATISDIKNKSSLEGANAWMLMCSIVIASIGLSQNSQAVIIGAMLISPLMSPILGIGVSIGINDMETLRTSLTHFTIAIFIALLTSYIYFVITPFDEVTNEITARTKPTFLDIFVALFGGLAGIISIARKDISTTIPGVAIATALMPPLCVTGYGLAMNDLQVASAAFYLFFLNTFFVALSTYLMVRFLDFPYRHFLNRANSRKNIAFIVAFSLTLVVPSFFIFRDVVRTQRFNSNFKAFKNECLGEDRIYLDDHNIGVDSTGQKTIYLKVYGNVISMDRKEEYLACLNNCDISEYDLQIISTSEVNIGDVQLLSQDLKSIAAELEKSQIEKIKTTQQLNYYEQVHIDSTSFDQIKKEVKALYPDIIEFGLASVHTTDYDTTRHDLTAIMIKWNDSPQSVIIEKNKRLQEYLMTRMQLEEIKLLEYK